MTQLHVMDIAFRVDDYKSTWHMDYHNLFSRIPISVHLGYISCWQLQGKLPWNSWCNYFSHFCNILLMKNSQKWSLTFVFNLTVFFAFIGKSFEEQKEKNTRKINDGIFIHLSKTMEYYLAMKRNGHWHSHNAREPCERYAKWKKLGPRNHVPYDSIDTKCPQEEKL